MTSGEGDCTMGGMAKGSGGVGKGKGGKGVGASVSGVAAKAAVKAVDPGSITASMLRDAAASLPQADKFGRFQTFLGPLMAKMGLTPEAAKAKLWDLHQDGKITLARADLVEAMNPAKVAASQIQIGKQMFHLVEFD